jgi:hypothetical protein
MDRRVLAALIVASVAVVALAIYFSPGESCMREQEGKGVATVNAIHACKPNVRYVFGNHYSNNSN